MKKRNEKNGTLPGPDHTVPIPEFSTIAIPIASILGQILSISGRLLYAVVETNWPTPHKNKMNE